MSMEGVRVAGGKAVKWKPWSVAFAATVALVGILGFMYYGSATVAIERRALQSFELRELHPTLLDFVYQKEGEKEGETESSGRGRLIIGFDRVDESTVEPLARASVEISGRLIEEFPGHVDEVTLMFSGTSPDDTIDNRTDETVTVSLSPEPICESALGGPALDELYANLRLRFIPSSGSARRDALERRLLLVSDGE